MPQNVPEFRFSDDALRLRQFLYEHWCAHGAARISAPRTRRPA